MSIVRAPKPNQSMHEITDELEELVRSDEKAARRRGASSAWHAPARYQAAQEELACCEFAKSLSTQGAGEISAIQKNEETDFPDCLARLDGNLVGIEVTELMDPDDAGTSWPQERFIREIDRIIRKKAGKASKDGRETYLKGLSQLILLIITDEQGLVPHLLEEYLRFRFPKSEAFDRAFLLGPYEPSDNAHIEGESGSEDREVPGHTVFEIRWIEA